MNHLKVHLRTNDNYIPNVVGVRAGTSNEDSMKLTRSLTRVQEIPEPFFNYTMTIILQFIADLAEEGLRLCETLSWPENC